MHKLPLQTAAFFYFLLFVSCINDNNNENRVLMYISTKELMRQCVSVSSCACVRASM